MIWSFRKTILIATSVIVFGILLGTSVLLWKEQAPLEVSRPKAAAAVPVGQDGLLTGQVWQEYQRDSPALGASVSETKKVEKPPIILMFAGDVMLDRGVEWSIKQNGEDWKWPFLKIAETLKQADLVFGNLESQISDKGRNVGSAYSFRADPKSMEGLVFAGFDVVSVANNHSFDYTREAFIDSLQRLRQHGISFAGGGFSKKEATVPVIKEVRGTTIGFLAYTGVGSPNWQATDEQPGIAWADWENLEAVWQNIQQAKSQVDILAVSLHAGEEYAKEPNEFQQAFAKAAIDAGADLIIGHHPHVVQSLVPYTRGWAAQLPDSPAKRGWIAYSLGNFVFDQGFSRETMEGLLLKVVVEDRAIKEVIPLKTKLNPSFQVELLSLNAIE